MSLPQLAYGAAATWAITVRNDDGSLVNVTGWTSRADIEKFDDRSAWNVVLALTNSSVTNGGAAGTLSLAITSGQTSGLASSFGNPTPNRLGRISFYSTPSGGSEALVFQALVEVLPTGATIQPFSSAVASETFAVNVSALSGTVYSDATTSQHGLHSTTDKRNHDALWGQETLLTPSGDTTGATDQAAINAACATGKSIRLAPTPTVPFYVDGGGADTSKLKCFDFTLKRGVSLTGAGAGSPSSGDAGTEVVYVGPRVPGRMMLCLDSCVNCYVTGIKFTLGLLEKAGTEIFNPGQPTGNLIEQCWFWGPSTGAVRATSTSNVTVGTGAKVFTTTAGLTQYFVDGSTALAASRSTGERLYGVVTYSGTSLTITVASDRDCVLDRNLGSHTHADWDLLIPPEGFTVTAAGSVYRQNWFARTWGIGRFDGCFKCHAEYNFYSGGTMYGIPLSVGASTSTSTFSGPVEPDAYGWNTLIDMRESLACTIVCETGDGGTFGPFVKIGPASAPKVTGTFQANPILGNTSAAIELSGTNRVMVDGCMFSTPYLVDFGTSGATSNHPQVTNNVSFGFLVVAVVTGTQRGGDYHCQQADLTTYQSVIKHDVATITTLTGTTATIGAKNILDSAGVRALGNVSEAASDKALANGNNLNQALLTPHVRIIGPTLAFALVSLAPTYSGERHRVWYEGSQVCTLPHLSATEETANRRLVCPGGVDLVSDGGPFAFDVFWMGAGWLVIPIYGFNVTNAKHITSKSYVDAAVAALPTTGLRWFNKAAPGGVGNLYIERSGLQASAVEGTSQIVVERAFTASYFAFNCGTALATDTITATVRKNGVDTALTFVIPAGTGSGTVISDSAHTVAFAKGDLISIKVVQSGTAAQANWYGNFVVG